MRKLYIIKVGTTFPETAKQYGDFDNWTATALGQGEIEIETIDAEHGATLPLVSECAGVVITGSHDMVTDNLPWSVAVADWLKQLLAEQTPILGICYGHQLLASAAGGEVGYHAKGKEIGTVEIELTEAAGLDPLFQSLPQTFKAHVTHSQTVLKLPENAVRLAANSHEPNQAFRLGNAAYGVQFHPEYNAAIMRSYIEEQTDELVDADFSVSDLLAGVSETPAAADLIKGFYQRICDTN
ncbi:glutamine amidotransferase [Methylophaga sp. OBS3]|uniref:glutamine amidotransferase n=1 Tax=Methylophaga sp. OBS3 TaxID=2991934 RepID=UPI00224ED218|nr:glutamine amidotransferase [Methylophaga sp. OBS3]MCX4190644.1 glutamine amidotransferase [Methylophaga sp. OBS3]